jgi:uncharacterized membrane protein
MTATEHPTAISLARSTGDTALTRSIRWSVARPATIFVILSMLFGLIIMALNPPLRGPDEPAHLLRSYGYAGGEILPSTEVNGRKGLYVPAAWNDGVEVYIAAQLRFWKDNKNGYTGHLDAYRRQQAATPPDDKRPPVFRLYEGSEAYTPVAYLPYIAAGMIARLFNFDFLATIYLMRLFGLVAMTAVAAYAIALTPRLKWAFFLIAMMPAALYGRTAVSADGATVSYALMVTALCLRAAVGLPSSTWQRAWWMLLCVLAKPPQIAFVLLEAIVRRFKDLPRHWKTVALVTLPGLILSPLWIVAVSGEMAAWRIVATTNLPAEQFDPVWKLGFMLQHPLHFPYAMLNTIVTEWNGLWRQLIGVLGWLDMGLQPIAYPLISAALIAVALERLDLDRSTRLRLALVSAVTVVAYTTAVYMILYMTWTPPHETTVWGVQGRYSIPALPAAAIVIAAAVNWGFGDKTRAGIAVAGALGSGIACIETLWRVLW